MKSAFLLMTVLGMGQSVFRADTRAVEITIIATRGDGSLVTDLRKDEIRVFDNNRQQIISSFDRAGGGNRTDAASAAAAPRLTIFVLDALNTCWGDQIYGREAVSQVLKGIPPSPDKIAIFALGDELHLLHDFSNDTASLKEAVDGYDGEMPFIGGDHSKDGCPDPPGFAVFNQEQRMFRTLDAFTWIAKRMKSVRGEKSLLWVSGAFPPPLGHQGIERAVGELTGAKVRLFPVDPRGLAPKGAGDRIGTMQEMAEPTGGEVFYASNDTTALVQAALDQAGEGYVLSFAPQDYREDGSYHDVRLKTSRKGVELSYRRGYIASPLGR